MSGETGIRTLGTLAGTPVFKTGAIGRSAISPGIRGREVVYYIATEGCMLSRGRLAVNKRVR